MNLSQKGRQVLQALDPDEAQDLIDMMQEIDSIQFAIGAVEHPEHVKRLSAAESRLCRWFTNTMMNVLTQPRRLQSVGASAPPHAEDK